MKIEQLEKLLQSTTMKIADNQAEWLLFLNTASRIYKYSFRDQIQIYAQRPDSIACASIDIWNKNMNCWINKGAKGIALINETRLNVKMRYVFDVSDVTPVALIGHTPIVWKVEKRHYEKIIQNLQAQYHSIPETTDFSTYLAAIVGQQSGLNQPTQAFLQELQNSVVGSALAELPQEELFHHYKSTMEASMLALLYQNCAMYDNEPWGDLVFPYIQEFNTRKSINFLGNQVNDKCKPLLTKIGNIVKALDKEHGILYTEYIIQEKQTRRKEDGADRTDISEVRRLLHPEFNNRRGGAGTEQIRVDAQNLPSGTQTNAVLGNDTGGTVFQSSSFHPGPSHADARGLTGKTYDPGEHQRRSETQGSDVVGTENEQSGTKSGRNRIERTDLSIETPKIASGLEPLAIFMPEKEVPGNSDPYEQISLFATVEEQLGNLLIDHAELPRTHLKRISRIDDTTIQQILMTGGALNHSPLRIYAEYRKGKSAEEVAAFLKKEYQTGGKGFTFQGPISTWFDEKGMRFAEGNAAKQQCDIVLTWAEVETHTRTLITSGRFLNQIESNQVIPLVKKELADNLYFFFRNMVDELPMILREEDGRHFSYSDAIKKMTTEIFPSQALLSQFQTEVTDYVTRVKSGEITPRFRLRYDLDELCIRTKELHQLLFDAQEFPLSDDVIAPTESFITQDEIDYVLCRGSNIQSGKNRIYEFYMDHQNASNREIEMFLKEEYGSGGRTHALPGRDSGTEDHDGKGISLSKGSILTPDSKVLIGWNKVAQRIGYLIKSKQYFTPKGLENYQQWKREREEKQKIDRQTLVSNYVMDTTIPVTQMNASSTQGEKVIMETLPQKDLQEVIENIPQVDVPKATEEQEVVAIESSEDFTDNEVGFFTSHQGNGTIEHIKYRLVTLDKENGGLKVYGNPYTHFINEAMIQAYIEQHQKKIKVISYDDIVSICGAKGSFTEVRTEEMPPSIIETSSQKAEQFSVKKLNFVIEDDALGQGTAKEKYMRNVAAIRMVKELEQQGRLATKEEQLRLSQYVGWGGLADAFDESKTAWTKEYQELKTLLDEMEYASARESTLNAHYTQPIVIREMYQTLERMGFQKGNILEPAMGVGNFFGMLPTSMESSNLYGVELDALSGRIATQLYQSAKIQIQGFEKTTYPNDFFDVAIGNVPFGNYKVADKKYDKHHFLIHDYFFAKGLDQVRPGGIVAFITSKGTLDKENPSVRRYLSQRAELVGAVRLPNIAFKANAGTEVTSDIIFLKKRDRIIDLADDWVYTSTNEDGLVMNQYFVDHPEQMVGQMKEVSGPFGMDTTCVLENEAEFETELKRALSGIHGVIEPVLMEVIESKSSELIPADPTVNNYSFTVIKDQVYYRENSMMTQVEVNPTAKERIRGLVNLRDITKQLIEYQMNEYSDDDIQTMQEALNQSYDAFVSKYGLISSMGNRQAFQRDNSYYLLSSLEVPDSKDSTIVHKADMFTKRTIRQKVNVVAVDTSHEALMISLQEKAKVDIPFMGELTSKSEHDVIQDLTGVIFQNPVTKQWETSDQYLSGNVREKLKIANEFAINHPQYRVNAEALTNVMPVDLTASEIAVRLGATWIDPSYLEQFMKDVLGSPRYMFYSGKVVNYSTVTGQWNIAGKNADRNNSLVKVTYGTDRINAYEILESSLNLKDVRIFDKIEEDGKEKRVLNKQETLIAQQKQEALKEAFQEWIFKDPTRRAELCQTYNEMFNSTRPREYDGSHLVFPGMNPEINLNDHQKDAVARVLYGSNSLLAHCVGAGKTYSMTTAAMEGKRLGVFNKSLFVVPNHLTEQWASEFLQLYPGANILAATKKDFEPGNRKRFCSRIATGEYDAIIIGHTQFERIPMSVERQIAMIERQIAEITQEVTELKRQSGERYTVKQLEKMKKTLSLKLDKLNDTTRKDNVVTFEQLGVDRLFVDESHSYKNLYLYTKMRNVAGIAQTEAQKSSDMYAKCQYMDELTGGKGVTFATGTPISNSMTELYTNMRYLQSNTLKKMGLSLFDSWASAFGETITAIELAPEGSGYRAKTRFAKFFNLPELISVFKESADIQTADMLQLPVPISEYHDVVTTPSSYQKEMVESLAERAELVRNRLVEPNEDNMLKITSDGRKLALDQRLMNELLPADANSKVQACVSNAYQLYQESMEIKGAQLIFCDLSTPNGNNEPMSEETMLDDEGVRFRNVYDELRMELIKKGVPESEIAYIHSANTDKRKADLFADVRSGQVRFLLGSTQKMGAGTNVQERLIGLHHLDVPWRPSDIEQREGRIIRQGNSCTVAHICRYITEGTFDAYSWQVIENKQKFISQIMTSKSPVRSADDIDEASLTYAEVKALATGNPYIKEKMDLDIQVSKLKLLKANHKSQIYSLEDAISKRYPESISYSKEIIKGLVKDIALYQQHKPSDSEQFEMQIGNTVYTEKKEAGAALLNACKAIKGNEDPVTIGGYLGFTMVIEFSAWTSQFRLSLKSALIHKMEVSSSDYGNIIKATNILEGMELRLNIEKEKLMNSEAQLETAKIEVQKPFPKEQELQEKLTRLTELNALLNMESNGEPTKLELELKEDQKEMQKGR